MVALPDKIEEWMAAMEKMSPHRHQSQLTRGSNKEIMMNAREEIRMKLWCDSYVRAFGRNSPSENAEAAVAAFDLAFPRPEQMPKYDAPPG